MNTQEEKKAPAVIERHMRIPLAVLNAVEATKVYFTDDAEHRERQTLPEVELSDTERTPEGFIELGWEHLETQKALHDKLRHACRGPLNTWPEPMRQRATAAVDMLNATREEPIDIATTAPTFLFRLSEPRWVEESAKDTAHTWPKRMQRDLRKLREFDDKLQVLSADDELRREARERWGERAEVMKQAATISRRQRQIDEYTKEIAEIRIAAAERDEALSPGDKEEIAELESHIQALCKIVEKVVVDENGRERTVSGPAYLENDLPERLLGDLAEEIERRSRKELRRQYERGLVLTDDMKQIIKEVVPSLIRGNPALFVGETGGAKTALAKYIAREILGKEPEIISGYADVNSYQVIGKTGLETNRQQSSWVEVLEKFEEMGIDWDNLSDESKAQLAAAGLQAMTLPGTTESVFVPGPVIRAVEQGRPLILDEINAMPPEFLKRLNIILQLRPGDTFTIQEDSGRVVTIQPGFCIIATANEKSLRYQGVHNLSAEFENRFAANKYHVPHPDADTVVGQDPLDNYKLSYAAVSDAAGNVLFTEGVEKLEAFARAAHITQRLLVGSVNDGYLSQKELDVISSERKSDLNAAGLDSNVLAPRTMAAILEKVVEARGAVTLQEVLQRWVDSIKSAHDKKTIKTILSSRSLIGNGSAEQHSGVGEGRST